MKTKFFEAEGMKSAGEASQAEVRDGKYNAEYQEPDISYDPWMTYDPEPKFGGSVGRPEGEER